MADRHGKDIQRGIFMNMFDGIEERCWVVGRVAGVRDTGVTKDMVPEQQGVQQTVSELGNGCSF